MAKTCDVVVIGLGPGGVIDLGQIITIRIEISGLNVMALGIYVEVLQRWLGDCLADHGLDLSALNAVTFASATRARRRSRSFSRRRAFRFRCRIRTSR